MPNGRELDEPSSSTSCTLSNGSLRQHACLRAITAHKSHGKPGYSSLGQAILREWGPARKYGYQRTAQPKRCVDIQSVLRCSQRCRQSISMCNAKHVGTHQRSPTSLGSKANVKVATSCSPGSKKVGNPLQGPHRCHQGQRQFRKMCHGAGDQLQHPNGVTLAATAEAAAATAAAP